jgi:hypothetical protein
MSVPAADDLRKFTFSDVTATRYMTTAADLIDAIDALHQPQEGLDEYLCTEPWCPACANPWPCETHRLLHPEWE